MIRNFVRLRAAMAMMVTMSVTGTRWSHCRRTGIMMTPDMHHVSERRYCHLKQGNTDNVKNSQWLKQ
ncbi:MAG: hypothetical protein MK110_04610 [Fuerstiella sp.]|nr:hypothetical protein [Fuerstiella sp.]